VAKELDCGDYVIYIVDGLLYLAYPDEEGNATITLKIALEDIKKIDKKYLPDDIGGNGGGTSIDVTAEVGQTIIVKEVDANGKPTKWESADYQPRTHYEGEGVIFEHTFVNVGEFVNCGGFPKLNRGETYKIVWNGVEYSCEAIDGSVMGEDGVDLIGNFGAITGEGDTGEPFVAISAGGEVSFIVLDGSTTVTLSVIGNGFMPIPQEYIGNAFPYEILLGCETELDSELICNESVEKIEAVYLSGRSIIANDGGGIYTLISVTNTLGLEFEFYRPKMKVDQIWHCFITLSAKEDGTYSATRRVAKCSYV
jgi:hypothetical protein